MSSVSSIRQGVGEMTVDAAGEVDRTQVRPGRAE